MTTPDGTAPVSERLTLADGRVAHLVPRDGGWTLEIDGVRQSHVGPAGAPPALTSVRWLLAALGAGEAISCVHLGGGLLTLPRALAEVRPGSRQVVVELEPALVEVARTRFGLPDGVSVQVGDARAWLAATAERDLDAVVIDVFSGGRVPPAFTSLECFTQARGVLADDGVLVLNSVAGPELDFTRRQLATLGAVFGHVAMIVQGSSLHGARFGNATLIASDAPLPADRIRAALAGDASRGALVTDVAPITGDAAVVRDRDELWSPEPQMPDVDAALRLLEKVEQVRATLAARRAAPPDGARPG